MTFCTPQHALWENILYNKRETELRFHMLYCTEPNDLKILRRVFGQADCSDPLFALQRHLAHSYVVSEITHTFTIPHTLCRQQGLVVNELKI